MTLRQIVLPFFNHYPGLSHYWWHRLFFVIFGILFIVGGAGGIFAGWIIPYEYYHNENRSVCSNAYPDRSSSFSPAPRIGTRTRTLDDLFIGGSGHLITQEDVNKYWQDRNKKEESMKLFNSCIEDYHYNYAISISTATAGGILVALLVGYLIQLVYFKVILYIFIGSKLREFRKH